MIFRNVVSNLNETMNIHSSESENYVCIIDIAGFGKNELKTTVSPA